MLGFTLASFPRWVYLGFVLNPQVSQDALGSRVYLDFVWNRPVPPGMLSALAASHTFLGLNDDDIFKGTPLIYFADSPSVGTRLLLSSCLD